MHISLQTWSTVHTSDICASKCILSCQKKYKLNIKCYNTQNNVCIRYLLDRWTIMGQRIAFFFFWVEGRQSCLVVMEKWTLAYLTMVFLYVFCKTKISFYCLFFISYPFLYVFKDKYPSYLWFFFFFHCTRKNKKKKKAQPLWIKKKKVAKKVHRISCTEVNLQWTNSPSHDAHDRRKRVTLVVFIQINFLSWSSQWLVLK